MPRQFLSICLVEYRRITFMLIACDRRQSQPQRLETASPKKISCYPEVLSILVAKCVELVSTKKNGGSPGIFSLKNGFFDCTFFTSQQPLVL